MRILSLAAGGAVLLSLFVSTGLKAAIPFEDKFTRQNQPHYKGGHAFRKGEQVKAALRASSCEGMLSLTVAEGVPGGVGDIRHSDTFQLVDVNPLDAEKLRDWRGMSFLGTVEIVSAVEKGFTISNMYEYKARIVSLESPNVRINPAPGEIENIKPETEIILLGKVLAAEFSDKRSVLKLQTLKHKYTVTLWSGIPVIESDLSGKIRNLQRDDRLQVGDEVQLKVYKAKEGGLATHWCRTCNLDNPSPDRYSKYLAERQQASHLIAELKTSVSNNYFQAFRQAQAKLLKLKLTPSEVVRLKKLWAKLPEAERPLLLTDQRYEVPTIQKAFGVDIDGLTVAEFKTLCHDWASMKRVGLPRAKGESLDESYLYRVWQNLGLPKSELGEIARKTAESRLAYFIKRSESGLTYVHDVDWSERYNLERGLDYSGKGLNAERISFLIANLKKIAELEKAGWGYNGEFLYAAVKGLRGAVDRSLEHENEDAKDAHAQLMLQKNEIEQIYSMLEAVPTENPGGPGKITVIGMPMPKQPTSRQRKSQFASELREIAEILSKI